MWGAIEIFGGLPKSPSSLWVEESYKILYTSLEEILTLDEENVTNR